MLHVKQFAMRIFEKNCMFLGEKCQNFRKSGRFCTGKCVKFSYTYIKNAIKTTQRLSTKLV